MDSMWREPESGVAPQALLLAVLFASGAAALIYEVLWLRELGRLLRVTAQAAAVTFAVFFFGLAAGSVAWGRVAQHLRSPLRAYALLEIGIIGGLTVAGLMLAWRLRRLSRGRQPAVG